MADTEWRNLAEDAINELFKEFVGEQLLLFVSGQMLLSTFVSKVTTARSRRQSALDAIGLIL